LVHFWLTPNNPDNPALLANHGATLAVLGRFNEAEQVLRASIRQWPNNPNAYNSLAQVYLHQNKHEQAGNMLLLAVTINPNFGTGHVNLALLCVMLNQHDQAKAHLKRAFELGVSNSMTDNLQRVLQNPPPK